MSKIEKFDEKSLLNVKKNTKYKIKDIKIQNTEIVTLLSNLGINKNENVTVLKSNYLNKTILINISGTNFALDSHLCEGIIVE